MRLNLGCGDYPAADWVNVDAYGGAKADVFSGLDDLPFGDGSATHVYLGHVLEHIAVADLPAVLVEVRRVLAPDGALCAVGPDCDRIDARIDPALFKVASQGHDGIGLNPHAAHLWSCTEALLLEYLRPTFPSVRAVLVADVPQPWPVVVRSEAWQCAALA